MCGSIWNASQHAEEFAYDYGESVTNMLDVNTNMTQDSQEQLTVDFEEELKSFNLFGQQQRQQQSRQNIDTSLLDAYEGIFII